MEKQVGIAPLVRDQSRRSGSASSGLRRCRSRSLPPVSATDWDAGEMACAGGLLSPENAAAAGRRTAQNGIQSQGMARGPPTRMPGTPPGRGSPFFWLLVCRCQFCHSMRMASIIFPAACTSQSPSFFSRSARCQGAGCRFPSPSRAVVSDRWLCFVTHFCKGPKDEEV